MAKQDFANSALRGKRRFVYAPSSSFLYIYNTRSRGLSHQSFGPPPPSRIIRVHFPTKEEPTTRARPKSRKLKEFANLAEWQSYLDTRYNLRRHSRRSSDGFPIMSNFLSRVQVYTSVRESPRITDNSIATDCVSCKFMLCMYLGRARYTQSWKSCDTNTHAPSALFVAGACNGVTRSADLQRCCCAAAGAGIIVAKRIRAFSASRRRCTEDGRRERERECRE